MTASHEIIFESVLEALKEFRAHLDEEFAVRDTRTERAMRNLNEAVSDAKKTAVGAQRALEIVRQARAAKPSARSIIIKSILARAIAKPRRMDPAEVAKQLYFDNDAVQKALQFPEIAIKALTNPAMTSVNGWAAELVGQTRNYGLIAGLSPSSVYAQLATRGISVDLAGIASMRFLSRPGPSSGGSIFIGEGQPIPVRQLSFSGAALTAKRVGTMSLFTAEIARHSTPAAEAIIGQALEDDTAIAIDAALLDSAAASTIRPAGLLNGALALTPSDASDAATAALADISALAGAFDPGAQSPVVIAASAQATALGLLYPANAVDVISSDALAAGTVVMIDAADFACVVQGGEIEVNDDAALHTEDTSPLPLATGSSGASAITAAPVLSTWQHDLFNVRLIEDIGWQMRRPGRVQYMEDVNW